MKKTCILLLSLPVYLFSETAIAQSNYWDPRPIAKDKQEEPTETKAARIVIAPPRMPSSAKRSGFCCIKYNVNEDGNPINITTPFCNMKKFRKPTIKAVKKWRFNPAISNGKPLRTNNYTGVITYRLTTPGGSIIPDKDGLVLRDGITDFSEGHLCPKLEIS